MDERRVPPEARVVLVVGQLRRIYYNHLDVASQVANAVCRARGLKVNEHAVISGTQSFPARYRSVPAPHGPNLNRPKRIHSSYGGFEIGQRGGVTDRGALEAPEFQRESSRSRSAVQKLNFRVSVNLLVGSSGDHYVGVNRDRVPEPVPVIHVIRHDGRLDDPLLVVLPRDLDQPRRRAGGSHLVRLEPRAVFIGAVPQGRANFVLQVVAVKLRRVHLYLGQISTGRLGVVVKLPAVVRLHIHVVEGDAPGVAVPLVGGFANNGFSHRYVVDGVTALLQHLLHSGAIGVVRDFLAVIRAPQRNCKVPVHRLLPLDPDGVPDDRATPGQLVPVYYKVRHVHLHVLVVVAKGVEGDLPPSPQSRQVPFEVEQVADHACIHCPGSETQISLHNINHDRFVSVVCDVSTDHSVVRVGDGEGTLNEGRSLHQPRLRHLRAGTCHARVVDNEHLKTSQLD
mmetsp:Transcript_13483/g.24797  ORF Transcript_13483/g.24797 Transcript_13483/m.24797 type:complete len:454 (+) Transcript_13483:4891-6252(+)